MQLSTFTPTTLKQKIEHGDPFQIGITPIFPKLYPSVKQTAERLEKALEAAGYEVLLDDRNQKPQNMFEVIAFLGVTHRITISNRSIDADVYEYKNLRSGEYEKIKTENIIQFIKDKTKNK